MKFLVTITRTGYLFVEAETEAEAMDIANHQLTDKVYWDDDWNATDCQADDTEPDCMYIKEKAFE
ncbi:MAG: hypothetical protein PUF72_05455 [Clostridiales bacterium]|nr:hypothetical protein [Clostridiales bacterium]